MRTQGVGMILILLFIVGVGQQRVVLVFVVHLVVGQHAGKSALLLLQTDVGPTVQQLRNVGPLLTQHAHRHTAEHSRAQRRVGSSSLG